tara:strand:+ start:8346 stop:8879 length:534 start_codon:yes stop_codon:yes gene_type:complete
MRYPLMVPMIGHGATDIIDLPSLTIFFNMFFSVFIHNCNLENRKKLLIGSSIYHIAQDIPFKCKYVISSIIHYVWLKKPKIAKLHLLLIHTPLHYLRIYLKKDQWIEKFSVGILTSLTANILLEKNIDIKLNKYLGELWWITPVISHIILTDIIKIHFLYYYKKRKNSIRFKKIVTI